MSKLEQLRVKTFIQKSKTVLTTLQKVIQYDYSSNRGVGLRLHRQNVGEIGKKSVNDRYCHIVRQSFSTLCRLQKLGL